MLNVFINNRINTLNEKFDTVDEEKPEEAKGTV